MARKRLIWQIFPAFVFITLLALVLVSYYIAHSVEELEKRQTRAGLAARAALVRALVEQARFDDADYSATYDEMVEKYKAIQVDLAKEAIWIPLVQPSDIVAYRDEVQNFNFHPLYGIRYNVDVWLSE